LAKRLFDIVCSLLGLIVLSPLLLLVSVVVTLDSRGGVLFRQVRVGRDNKHFVLFKFRTMKVQPEHGLKLTVGNNDSRITRVGKVLRKFKIDELPQLINVFTGEMSLVGPRPEVPKYVAMYNEEQMKVLAVKPVITDYASIKFRNENELLAKAEDPEQYYIDVVMPEKLALNSYYVKNRSFLLDIKLIFKTAILIFVKT
jgi:lipopolysaccharide/colanic/teichoic acid biosynthesis glycosyltransferase